MTYLIDSRKLLNSFGPNEQYFEGMNYASGITQAYQSYYDEFERIKTMPEGGDKYLALTRLIREIKFREKPETFNKHIRDLAVKIEESTCDDDKPYVGSSHDKTIKAMILVLYNEIQEYKDWYSCYVSPQEIALAKMNQRADIVDKIEDHEERIGILEQNMNEHNSFLHLIRNAANKSDNTIHKINQKDDANVLLNNAEFMDIMKNAVEQGFCQQSGWQFIWKIKGEAAFFAAQASEFFHMTDRKDHDGDNAISWKPFEALFNLENLRSAYNDIVQCKTNLKHKAEIQKLFK